jgi:transcriptional regulator with XRE-family HTH domain
VEKSQFIKDFGKKVQKLREEQGISQEAFAHKAGLHRTAISMIENSKRSSTLETIEKLARALDVPAAELMPEWSDA